MRGNGISFICKLLLTEKLGFVLVKAPTCCKSKFSNNIETFTSLVGAIAKTSNKQKTMKINFGHLKVKTMETNTNFTHLYR
jgi:hypothetical protein